MGRAVWPRRRQGRWRARGVAIFGVQTGKRHSSAQVCCRLPEVSPCSVNDNGLDCCSLAGMCPSPSSQEGLSKLLSPTSSSTTSFLAAEQIVARSFAPSSGQDGRKKKHKKKRVVETKRRARARPASPIHIHVHNAESTSSGAVSPVVGASRTPGARAVLLAI